MCPKGGVFLRRIPTEEPEVKNHRSLVNFLTGGTGFLGSHIGAELLRRRQETIFFIRKRRAMSGTERLEKMLNWHGVDRAQRAKAHVVEGDLENLGLELGRQMSDGIDRIIHCASDTSFSERKRKQVWSANVESLKGLLDFAAQSRISSFLHVSTAYAAGKRSGSCPEEPIEQEEFFNVYEEAKAAAEHMLLERCGDEGIPLTVIRPSIVYGHSRTGRTFRFNALYYPVKTALFLRKIFAEDIRERGGVKAASAGVSMEKDGTIRLPLRIDVGEDGGVNLIPVDFFVRAFFAILEDSTNGGIYHIVNSKQTPITDIINWAQNQFKLKGIQPCSPDEFKKTPRNSLEQLFERYLEAYAPYMKDGRIFLAEKTDSILKRHCFVCPEFDANMFQRCMAYALEKEWSGLSI